MKHQPAALTLLFIFFSVAGLAGPRPAQAAPSPAAQDIRIDFNRRVPMRDGVELSVDVYRPAAPGRFPVILSRTPYNKNSESQLELGRYFAGHGYVYAIMDVRGRGDSDGSFVRHRFDGRDGYDAIEWCAAQAWSTGKVGTFGGSYLGKNQWLAAVQRPPHLVAMVVMVTPSDPFVEWPTGLPLPMDISWHHLTSGRVLQNEEAVDWSRVHWHLPLYTMDEAAGRLNRNWKDQIDHARLDDFWAPVRYQDKYDRVQVPVLHISGWYDDEQIGTLLNFHGMRDKGPTEAVRRSQRLLMGPWPHRVLKAGPRLGEVEFGPGSVLDLKAYARRWFDHWLKGIDTGMMKEPPAHLFVMGEDRWVDEGEWPIARTRPTPLYLHSQGRANSLFGDGSLSEAPPGTEPADRYTYDPAAPVPFITEPSFAQIGGPDDYRPVERRDDVLVFTGAELSADTRVCGPVRAEVYAASSAPDTDFTAKLLDVWPNGFAQRLTDGLVRARFRDGMVRPALIQPGRTYRYAIDLWNTCQTFRKGHRVRVEISSSAFPKYDRNPNTGEALGKTTRLQTAAQVLYHDREHPSHVVLPIVSPRP